MEFILAKSFFWKLLERFSVQGSQFIIQVLLARMLSPEHYGALAIMMIFINTANVIIQNGFNTALIQNQDVNDDDFSSVFWSVLGISCLIYVFLYVTSPYISSFYGMPYLDKPFKIICLILIPGALNSVQLSIIRRNMDFKKEFTSNLVSIILSGFVGVTLAYLGFGLWALVGQTLLNTVIACITMWAVVGWRPAFRFNKHKVGKLFNYGYKLVLAGLLDTLSSNLSGLIIGAKYSSASLGYYTRGNQFPNAIMGALNSAVQSVMLPALSMLQDDRLEAKKLMRKAMILSGFFVFPMMAMLAGIAKPMVQLVLTEKWLPCVPYLQIFCFSYAFWPVHTSNLQAINAMGRSDIFLRLEIYKKILGWCALAVAVFCFDDPISIASTSIVMTLIGCFINCYPNKYLLKYSYNEQMKDILPYFGLSIAIFLLLINMENMQYSQIIVIACQLTTGTLVYLALCHCLKLYAYTEITNKIRSFFYNRVSL